MYQYGSDSTASGHIAVANNTLTTKMMVAVRVIYNTVFTVFAVFMLISLLGPVPLSNIGIGTFWAG